MQILQNKKIKSISKKYLDPREVIHVKEEEEEKEILKSIIVVIYNILSNIINENKKKYKNKKVHIKDKDVLLFSPMPPTDYSLFDYLLRIQKYTQLEDSSLIIGMIYLDRICFKKGIILTRENIHRVLFCSILAAIKYNEDIIFDMKFYANIAGVSTEELSQLEKAYLKMMDFNLFVNKKTFNLYKCLLNGEDLE